MKQKYIYSLFYVFIMFLSVLMSSCSKDPEISYIGKTRDEIIAESEKWRGQIAPDKITIKTLSGTFHFDKPQDIYSHEYLMHLDVWWINHYTEKGFFNKYCSYEIKFDNNIVVSQKIVCYSDAI
mgnify:FL=1